jgi:CARDB
MRFQLIVGALVICLSASAVASAATGSRAGSKPDLVVGSLTNPPNVVLQGNGFPVKDRTRDIGAAAAPRSVTQYFLVGADGRRTAAGRHAVPRLRAHRGATYSASGLVPSTVQPGTYSFVACADGTRRVKEASERNNCRTAATKLVVKKPPPPV